MNISVLKCKQLQRLRYVFSLFSFTDTRVKWLSLIFTKNTLGTLSVDMIHSSNSTNQAGMATLKHMSNGVIS